MKALCAALSLLLLASACASTPSDGTPRGALAVYTTDNPIPVRPVRNPRAGASYEILFKVVVRNNGLLPVEIRRMTVELVDPSRGVLRKESITPDDARGSSGFSGSGVIEPKSNVTIPVDLSEDITDLRLMERAMIQVRVEGVDESGNALEASTASRLDLWQADR